MQFLLLAQYTQLATVLNKINRKNSGVTAVELLVVLSIITVLSVLIITSFVTFRKNQALVFDTDTVVGVLRQARNQTLSSKNSSNYGVHFTAPKITIFTGSTFNSNASGNQDFVLSSTDTILTISLTGGGSDVVFSRLSGETSQNGTVVVSSPGVSETKTVTIYKTGLVESQ